MGSVSDAIHRRHSPPPDAAPPHSVATFDGVAINNINYLWVIKIQPHFGCLICEMDAQFIRKSKIWNRNFIENVLLLTLLSIFLKKSVDFLVNFEQFMFDEYRTYEL